MKRTIYPLIFALFVTACSGPVKQNSPPAASDSAALPQGVTLIEHYEDQGQDLVIPFSKYRLDNGLTVILHEDHSDPLVHVDVTYHVGSAREAPGRSGLAHFFEHMMFEGSANVASGQFSKIISEAGGTLNGTTNSDRTNYFETVPANQLETTLWLEADRMGLLLEAVSQEQFEIQRAAVLNERGQRIDNQPYGRVSETLMRNLYPPRHPYSWPVIGWREDIEAATLADLERFFLRWYGPNNATLTIGGDLDPAQTLEWIARYFGPIPPAPDATKLPPEPGKLDSDRYVTLEDNIHLPAIAMLYPTVHYRHPDEAPLDAAAKILGQGKASLLYQRLVQTGRAVSAFVSHACRELACEMMFVVIQNPASGETLAEMETAIRRTLREFADRKVSEDDLLKFKAGYESGEIFALQSVAGKVRNLASAETFSDDPELATSDLQRYLAVNREDVVRSFREYIEGRPAVILSVVPNAQTGLAARPQDFDYRTMTPAAVPAATATGSPPEPELRRWTDEFDRSIRPQPGANPIVDLPPVWDLQLANGVRLLAVPNTETPTTTVQAVFAMGQRDEPPGKAGLASLTAAMMAEATRRRSAAEFSEALERIGASLGVAAGSYETSITLNVLSKHLDTGIALLLERLLEPAFSGEDFERLRSQRMESLMQARKSGPALANRAIEAVLAGPEHPMSYPNAGLPSTVSNITLDDVRAFYATHIPAHLEGVLASSSLPLEALLTSLQGLGDLQTAGIRRPPIEPLPPIEGRTIYLVDRPGAAQSSLRLAHPSLKYDALGAFYRAGLMNFNLGGSFDSRLNLNLREDKGFTYGISSGFAGGPELGSFRVSSEVEGPATAAAVHEILAELESYAAAGMTAEEYRYLQSALGQRDALRYETPGAKLGLLSGILRYELPLDYRHRQQEILRETGRAELNQLAGRLLMPDDIAIVVVGDRSEIQPQLESLGLPIRLLDEDGFELLH